MPSATEPGRGNSRRYADVVIVGAGPVGLTLAILLGQRSVTTLVVERNRGLSREPRAIAFDGETLRTLQGLGMLDAMRDDIRNGLDADFLGRRGQPLIEVRRSPQPYGHPPSAAFYQPGVERALLRAAEDAPTVSVLFEHRLVDFDNRADGVTAFAAVTGRVEPARIDARFLIACDGGSSGIRERLGIAFEGSTFRQRWLVIDTDDEQLDQTLVQFICKPERPTVTLSSKPGKRRWEFLLRPDERPDAMLEPDAIAGLLSDYLDPSALRIERKAVYTFHARCAARYRERSVFLAGDAAHIMPPFAGQGLNSGIRDALNLAWKLDAVLRRGADDGLLDTYEQERREHAIRMMRLAVFLGSIVMPQSRWRAVLRDSVFAVIRRVRRWREFFEHGGLVPEAELAPSEAWIARRGGLAGKMLVQPRVEAGGERHWLDDLLGPGFAVIGLGCDPKVRLAAVDRDYCERLEARWFALGADASAAATERIDDPSAQLIDWMRSAGADAVLVRPDRFVAADFAPGDTSPRLHSLGRLLPGYSIAPGRDENGPVEALQGVCG